MKHEALYTFSVPGDPVTWKRARRNGKRSYTDPLDAAHRDKIRAYARNAGIRRPLEGAVMLDLLFVSSRADDPTDLRVGDLDNLEKIVKDALKSIAFNDDRQVTDVVKRKRVSRENPRTEIGVWHLGAGGEGETPG